MKPLLAIVLSLALCACARQVPPRLEDHSAASSWQAMLADSAQGPYRMQMSLRFGAEGDTRRVTAILWGNNETALRLDVQAGVGATVAKILEEGDHFLIFVPQENRAYVHDGPNRPLLRIGTPLPFTLIQLADILNGRYANVFGREYRSEMSADKGGMRYELEGGPGGALILDSAGQPAQWRGDNGWRMTFQYADSSSRLPSGLNLSAPDGKKAIIMLKSREVPEKPFPAAQMELKLPEETPVLPLAKYRAS